MPELEKLYTLARRAKNEGNGANAAKYYEMILLDDPTSWEATFYSVYYTSSECVIGQISTAAKNAANAFQSAFDLITDNVQEEKRSQYYSEIDSHMVNLLNDLRAAAVNHYRSYATVDGARQQCASRCLACGTAFCNMGDKWYSIGDKENAAHCYKNAQIMYTKFYNLSSLAMDRIHEVDPSYAIETKKGGCYVATCVYGSYDCPEVWTLRRYRDNTLASTWYGRAFIHTYYAISPTLVKWFGNYTWFKGMWKGKLDTMVEKLQKQGVENTPYHDKEW